MARFKACSQAGTHGSLLNVACDFDLADLKQSPGTALMAPSVTRLDVPQIDSQLIIVNPADRGIDHPDEHFAGCADGQLQHMTAVDLMLLIGEHGMEMNVRGFIHGCDAA